MLWHEGPYILRPGAEWKPYIRPPMSELSQDLVKRIVDEIKHRVEKADIELKDLDVFRDIVEKCSPGERCEGIIVNPKAFYVPYHCYPREWGIYFRIHKIFRQFEDMLKLYGAFLGVRDIETAICVWNVYMAYIYWHELTHNIIEDICTPQNANYPLLCNVEEEELAKWHAFSTAERRLPNNKRFSLILSSNGRTMKNRNEFRRRVLSVMYCFLNRDKDPLQTFSKA